MRNVSMIVHHTFLLLSPSTKEQTFLTFPTHCVSFESHFCLIRVLFGPTLSTALSSSNLIWPGLRRM